MEICKCQGCGLNINETQATSHLVRMGYTLAKFPLLSFERLDLCPACLEKQKVRDKWEKRIALVLLGLVCFFLGLGYLMLFNLV